MEVEYSKCPRCGSTSVERELQQGWDEASTVYRCQKCGHGWRE